jgi:integrase
MTQVINVDPASFLPKEHVVVAKPTKIDEAVETYLGFRERKQFSPKTMLVDERILRKFAMDMGGMQVKHMKPDHVTNWFYGKGGLMEPHTGKHKGGKILLGIANSTHNQYRSRLKVFFEWMTKRGMTKVDLLEDVDMLKVPTRVRQQPKPGVLLAFLDSAVHPRDRAYLALAINSALRASEVIRITIGDVDLERGYFKITTSKRKQGDWMPITEDLDIELRRWFKDYEIDAGRPLEKTDFLFPNITSPQFDRYVTNLLTGKRMLLRTQRRVTPEICIGIQRTVDIVHRALKAAELPTKGEGTHTIRRAVARAYFDSMRGSVGRDNALRETSALLHHAQSGVTERYLGLSTERDARDFAMKGKPFLSAMLGTAVAD